MRGNGERRVEGGEKALEIVRESRERARERAKVRESRGSSVHGSSVQGSNVQRSTVRRASVQRSCGAAQTSMANLYITRQKIASVALSLQKAHLRVE